VTRILLLLDHRENREILARELSSGFEVMRGESDADFDQAFDLCILDGLSLDRLRDRVERWKEEAHPIFLPVLLATSRPGVKMITRQVWRSVDDLIVVPVEKAELHARIQILLRARSLSLALRRRADDAEQASRQRDEVLAMVAHDLRNPLNLALTCASFLLEGSPRLGPPEREQLQMIVRAAGQMNRLIRDLLEVSEMEAGNLSIEARSQRLEPLIREACAVQTHAATRLSIEISCDFDGELPRVTVDRDRMHQVLGNLLGNAIKFTGEGGTVHVRVERDGAHWVRVSVADTGAGIDEVDLPHVFDRFWQVRRSREGAGLGLAISRAIVAAHGGEIWAESQLGQGSTFYFRLPAEVTGPE